MNKEHWWHTYKDTHSHKSHYVRKWIATKKRRGKKALWSILQHLCELSVIICASEYSVYFAPTPTWKRQHWQLYSVFKILKCSFECCTVRRFIKCALLCVLLAYCGIPFHWRHFFDGMWLNGCLLLFQMKYLIGDSKQIVMRPSVEFQMANGCLCFASWKIKSLFSTRACNFWCNRWVKDRVIFTEKCAKNNAEYCSLASC